MHLMSTGVSKTSDVYMACNAGDVTNRCMSNCYVRVFPDGYLSDPKTPPEITEYEPLRHDGKSHTALKENSEHGTHSTTTGEQDNPYENDPKPEIQRYDETQHGTYQQLQGLVIATAEGGRPSLKPKPMAPNHSTVVLATSNMCEKPTTKTSKPDDDYEIVTGATMTNQRHDVKTTPQKCMPIHANRALPEKQSGFSDTSSGVQYQNLDP